MPCTPSLIRHKQTAEHRDDIDPEKEIEPRPTGVVVYTLSDVSRLRRKAMKNLHGVFESLDDLCDTRQLMGYRSSGR
jgi:hypothetical protein